MAVIFLRLGAFAAFTAVALGAFGAHRLKNVLTPEMLDIYKTGVTYQMWHALGLLMVALLLQQIGRSNLLNWAGWLLVGGILLFSGSLYVLALLNLKWLGMVTPFGGLAFLAAWLLLGVFAMKKA